MPRRKQQGKGIKDVLNKVNRFLKKTKIISKAAGLIGTATGNPMAGAAAGMAAGMAGYGQMKGRGKARKLKTG